MVFSSSLFWLALAIAGAILLPLAWISWKGESETSPRGIALFLRALGILFIAFAISDPQTVGERPVKGANIVAVLADNSMGMRIKDIDTKLSRGEFQRDYLSGANSEWISGLKNDYQIRSYAFDKQVHRSNGFEALNFDGQYSNIGKSLLAVSSRLEGNPLAGIVILTDGNATDGHLSDELLERMPPLYPVLLGAAQEVPDIAIRNLKVSQSAFGDSPLKAEAKISLSSLGEQTVKTQLRQLSPQASALSRSSALVDERIGTMKSDQALSFEWRSPGGGIQFFELTTEPVDPNVVEATGENNRRLFSVDRGQDVYRLLYVTGRPNWEYKFLNRALAEDPQLDVVGLIRVASREPNFDFKGRAGENSNSLYRGFGREDETERYDEAVLIRMNTRDENELKTGFPSAAEDLFAYDAIVIDDLEARFFSFAQQTLIREFVKQRGGGLLLLGGVNALEDGGYENTPIAQALPVYLGAPGTAAPAGRMVHWDLTRNGWVEPWMRIRSFEADERQRIQEMPMLKVYNTLQRLKPGAETLATLEDSAAETYPALVTRKFGSGRVATLAVGDLWRWGMQNQGTQADLAQFWRQLSRWLVTDNPRIVELRTSQPQTSSITVTAIARDKAYRPLLTGIAQLSVQRVDAEQAAREYTMQAVSGKPGQYTAEIPLSEGGAYRASVAIKSARGDVLGSAETGWVNEPLVAEFASLAPQTAYLERLAAKTGGQVLELDQLDRLRSALEAQISPVMETWSKPLWHSNWFFAFALCCFLAEWLLRRKRGLA